MEYGGEVVCSRRGACSLDCPGSLTLIARERATPGNIETIRPPATEYARSFARSIGFEETTVLNEVP